MKLMFRVSPGWRVRVLTATSSWVVLALQVQKLPWPTWTSLVVWGLVVVVVLLAAAAVAVATTRTADRASRVATRRMRPACPTVRVVIGRVVAIGVSVKGRDDLGAHELDGLHDGLVADLVGVDQAQQEVDAGGLVLATGGEALLGRAQHTGVGVHQVLKIQQVEQARVVGLLHVGGVGV